MDKQRQFENVFKRKWIKIFCAVAAAGLAYAFAPESMPEAARRVLFVFVLAGLFWATEAIPLYATALLNVLLLTFLLCKPGGVLNMDEMGYSVFMLPFGSSIIMLFFGGLVMAAALQKYGIDKLTASAMLKFFGTNPVFVMSGFILCTAFLSMWMSNTATTAMMITMIIPLVRQMDADDPFRTALILCIPFAANIGGIATPIGTPPNAIAIGILANYGIHLSFFGWMKMAVPLALILLAVIGVTLTLMFPPKKKTINLTVDAARKTDDRTRWVMAISVFTVILWLTSEIHKIPSALTALLAAGLFVGTGLLTRDDFKTIDWDILVLMWGGLALGKGIEISGLTQWIVSQPIFEHRGFWLIAVFGFLSLFMSTFMSNTATANLIVPVAVAIPGENHILLVTMIALSCSAAMAFPISTPPNTIAFSTQMLSSRDMLKAGIVVSLIMFGLIIAGYQLVIPRAFGIH
ncbi:MAG: DASS family sodium-coupled anion symporter [Candidatus Omnitrophota bacterium]